jgi:hypothetical protein
VMNKVQVDAVNDTFGSKNPLDHVDYAHAHGQYETVMKFAEFQQELQKTLNEILDEERIATPNNNDTYTTQN